jgi:type II secretion system protein G
MIKLDKKIGFTLIELMIIIAILGVLAALISGNFITSLKKGRDARRKADLEQIQRALEIYYEDKKSYPTFNIFQSANYSFCETKIDTNCGTEKTYMQKIPTDPVPGNNYVYVSSGQSYQLYSCIENNLDQGPGVKQSGYARSCGSCGSCKYAISSVNTTPN